MTYHGLPTEDVGIETDPVLGNVEAAMDQNLFLEGAGVVCRREEPVRSQSTIKQGPNTGFDSCGSHQ